MASAHLDAPLAAEFFGEDEPEAAPMTATILTNAQLLADGARTLARDRHEQTMDLLIAAADIAAAAETSREAFLQAAHLAWPAASSTHHPAPAEVKPSTAAAPATLAGVDAGAVQGEQGCPFDEAL